MATQMTLGVLATPGTKADERQQMILHRFGAYITAEIALDAQHRTIFQVDAVQRKTMRTVHLDIPEHKIQLTDRRNPFAIQIFDLIEPILEQLGWEK